MFSLLQLLYHSILNPIKTFSMISHQLSHRENVFSYLSHQIEYPKTKLRLPYKVTRAFSFDAFVLTAKRDATVVNTPLASDIHAHVSTTKGMHCLCIVFRLRLVQPHQMSCSLQQIKMDIAWMSH